MKVPFFNYPKLYTSQKDKFLKVFDDVCSRGAYIMQKDLLAFEASISNFCNVKHAMGGANATDALEMALFVSGIQDGDEVIVPSHTMTATPSAIIANRGKPVLIDCGSDGLLDPDLIEKNLSDKTKYIMPVQLNGRTCKMDKIIEVAQKNNLTIIEDSAQGLGSTYKGKQAGTFGLAGVFSFYPAKILGTLGDGGMIITDDDDFANKIFQFRDHGRDNLDCNMWGRNSRLDNLHAAFLLFQFQDFKKTVDRRREIANMYLDALGNIDGLCLPFFEKDTDHFDTFQNFEILSDSRDKLKAYLADNGIGTIIQWGGKAIHQFDKLGLCEFDVPVTDKYFEQCLLLPMNTLLEDDEISYVIKKIKTFYE